MSVQQAYWVVAYPLLAAVLAVGALLLIKIVRHRQAAKDARRLDAVPAQPMSRDQARTLIRRYLYGAGPILFVLALVGVAVA